MSQADFVRVRRQWNDWRISSVPIARISGLHWSDYSGGVMARSPRPFLHGYIPCNALIEGEIAHSCAHGEGPHSIKVCIVEKDNPKEVFEALSALTPAS